MQVLSGLNTLKWRLNTVGCDVVVVRRVYDLVPCVFLVCGRGSDANVCGVGDDGCQVKADYYNVGTRCYGTLMCAQTSYCVYSW